MKQLLRRIWARWRPLTPDEAQNKSRFPFPWLVTYEDGQVAKVERYADLRAGVSYSAKVGKDHIAGFRLNCHGGGGGGGEGK